jgi:hypothetical protein
VDPSKQDHSEKFRVRPRFKVHASLSIEALAESIGNALQKVNSTCTGQVHVMGGTISIPDDQRHYWSPQLSFSFEEVEDGTVVRGLFGPRPTVWGLFVFFYSVIGIGILIIATIGLSKISLDKSGDILWWVPVLTVVFLSLYLVSYFGQKLGRKQMITLFRFFEEATGLRLQGKGPA